MSYTSPYVGVSVASDVILKLTASQSGNGKVFYLREDTGDYDVTLNPTGFGTPNFQRSDIGSSITNTGILMEIMLPGETAFSFGLDVPQTFINPGLASPDNIFAIAPEDIGLQADSIFPDGVYTVRYLVEDTANSGFLPPIVQYVLLAHNAQCKVYGALANVKDCDCCDGSNVDAALTQYAKYKSMLYNAQMGKIDNVNSLLECINAGDCGC